MGSLGQLSSARRRIDQNANVRLVTDLVALQIEEIGDLVARGTRRIQLDSLGYNQVFDDEFRASTGNAAVDPQLILAGSVAADTAVVSAVKAASLLRTGANASAWRAFP